MVFWDARWKISQDKAGRSPWNRAGCCVHQLFTLFFNPFPPPCSVQVAEGGLSSGPASAINAGWAMNLISIRACACAASSNTPRQIRTHKSTPQMILSSMCTRRWCRVKRLTPSGATDKDVAAVTTSTHVGERHAVYNRKKMLRNKKCVRKLPARLSLLWILWTSNSSNAHVQPASRKSVKR